MHQSKSHTSFYMVPSGNHFAAHYMDDFGFLVPVDYMALAIFCR